MNSFIRLGAAFVVALVAAVGLMPATALAFPVFIGDASQTTTGLNELMKITFDDTLVPEVIYDTELLDLMPDGKVKRGSEGRWFETSHLHRGPGSFGSRSEGGFIPVPQSAKAENGRINLKKILGSLDATAETLKKIKGSKSAFVDWAKEQFPAFREGLSDEIDRQALGDGSGIRGRVNAGVPATTLIVDSTFGIAGLDKTLMQFRPGMTIRASANADGSAPRDGVMFVEDIDWDSDAIIVDALATGLADDDYLFEGDAADNSAGKDMMGLFGLVDDGGIVETLQFIDRSVHRWFRSYVRDASAGGTNEPITEDLLIDVDRVSRQRSQGKVDAIVISEEGFNAVWGDLRADRVVNDPRSYTAGRKGIEVLFGGTRTVNLRTARKLPSRVAFGLQTSEFRKMVLHGWEWDDTTGSIWKQIITSVGRKDEFFAYGSMYGELAIRSAQRSWRLEGWIDPA